MGKLIAGGDSFTYGSELKDCYILGVDGPPVETASPHAYSSLIAREINLDYICSATPGFSNSAIRRTVMDACNNATDVDLVLVMWSFPGRYEFRFNNSWEQISPWSVLDTPEQTIRKDFQIDNPVVFQHHLKKLKREKDLGIQDFAKAFYSRVGSFEYSEVYSSLLDIVMLQQYLVHKNIPYLFTGVDESLVKNINRHLTDISIKTLFDQIDFNSWFLFPKEKGFYTWALDQRFPFGTTHPLEEAHIEAAHLIYEHLRYIGRLP